VADQGPQAVPNPASHGVERADDDVDVSGKASTETLIPSGSNLSGQPLIDEVPG
jgi:hypothetical protein